MSISILGFVLFCAYMILNAGNASITRDNTLLEVQEQSRNAMQRMVHEIRQASTQTITVISASSDSITFTIPTASNIKYYLTGTNLIREYPAGTTATVANSIAYLKFTLNSKLLTISVRADKTRYTQTVSFPLIEQVRLRNE